jgi:Fe2+ transport system protein FeoA
LSPSSTPETGTPAAPSARVVPAAPVRLSDLTPGCLARMHMANLAPQDCALLRALGLTDRCVLRICKIGEPCIVEVQSTRIGIARSVAKGILVVPESAG